MPLDIDSHSYFLSSFKDVLNSILILNKLNQGVKLSIKENNPQKHMK